MKDKWSQIARQWKQFSGEAKKKWDQLTDDEVSQVNGDRKTLVGLIEKRYGIARKAAQKQIDLWVEKKKV